MSSAITCSAGRFGPLPSGHATLLFGDASGGRYASTPELWRVGVAVAQLTSFDPRALHLMGPLDPPILEDTYFGTLGEGYEQKTSSGKLLAFCGPYVLLLVSSMLLTLLTMIRLEMVGQVVFGVDFLRI